MVKPAVPRSTVYTWLFKKLLLTSGQGKGKGGSNCCCSFSINYGHNCGHVSVCRRVSPGFWQWKVTAGCYSYKSKQGGARIIRSASRGRHRADARLPAWYRQGGAKEGQRWMDSILTPPLPRSVSHRLPSLLSSLPPPLSLPSLSSLHLSSHL